MAEPQSTKKPLRLGVLLSGGGRTLTNIVNLIQAGQLPAEVAVVIASRPCQGIDLARQAKLPAHLVDYKQSPDLEGTPNAMPRVRGPTYSAQIARLLDEAKAELVLLAGFLSFWKVPDRYLGRVMNIHPALLPLFGGHGMYGHHVHEAVLAAGCKVSGCTVHFVTNQYDAGPIVAQRCVPVLEGDTPEALAARVFEQECIAYPEAIRLFAEGRLKIDGNTVRVLPARK